MFRSKIPSAKKYNQNECSFLSLLMAGRWAPPCLWYGAVYKRQYTDKTLTLRKSMYMQASGASELRVFWHFHILKLLFLSIFCWHFRYFVGTNGMLIGLHIPTHFQMYRQNSEKSIMGGGGLFFWGGAPGIHYVRTECMTQE